MKRIYIKWSLRGEICYYMRAYVPTQESHHSGVITIGICISIGDQQTGMIPPIMARLNTLAYKKYSMRKFNEQQSTEESNRGNYSGGIPR